MICEIIDTKKIVGYFMKHRLGKLHFKYIKEESNYQISYCLDDNILRFMEEEKQRIRTIRRQLKKDKIYKENNEKDQLEKKKQEEMKRIENIQRVMKLQLERKSLSSSSTYSSTSKSMSSYDLSSVRRMNISPIKKFSLFD